MQENLRVPDLQKHKRLVNITVEQGGFRTRKSTLTQIVNLEVNDGTMEPPAKRPCLSRDQSTHDSDTET